MKLDFDKGEVEHASVNLAWNLKVDKVDASIVDNSDGVDVTFTIGSMSAVDNIDMRIDRLSYKK